MLQPRLIAIWFVLAVLGEDARPFLALSAVLWWSTLVPSLSVFDAIYNYLVAYPRGLRPLAAAPEPRRFAQTVAAVATLTIGAALLLDATTTAWVLQTLALVSLVAAVFLRVCAPANLYHRLRRVFGGHILRCDGVLS